MNAKRIFVTGTDTGVGKTVLSTILMSGLIASGVKAYYWKPIQTGTKEDNDSIYLKQWIGDAHVLKEAYAFKEPVSPHWAASLENQIIAEDEILGHIHQWPKDAEVLIIEGAGGILVPINEKYLMIDLIKDLKAEVIIATRSGLGTINHSLLTIEALCRREIPILGAVMMGGAHTSNREALEIYSQVKVLGEVPVTSTFSQPWFIESFKSISFRI